MPSSWQVIHLHPKAPAKPDFGAPCNGCGVCCAAEPCPVGIVLSGRRRGACSALRWDEHLRVYRCGALVAPEEVLPTGLKFTAPLLARLARRWIAAGSGCDATVTASPREETGT